MNTVLIICGIVLFILWVISWIVKEKTKNPHTNKGIVVNIASKIIFWGSTIMLSPILIALAIDFVIICAIVVVVKSIKDE